MNKNTSQEYEIFNNAMATILRADPKAVKEAMEADKQTNAKKRKAKLKTKREGKNGKNQ